MIELIERQDTFLKRVSIPGATNDGYAERSDSYYKQVIATLCLV